MAGKIPTVGQFVNPANQYVPIGSVNFTGPSGIVMGHPLPPRSMRFANPQIDKMLSVPGLRSIFENRRNGTTF